MIVRSSKLAAQMGQGPDLKRLNDQALKKACSEFEGLMLNMVLKGMRRTVNRSGFLDGGQGEKIFQDMYDQEITNQASMSGGVGLGKMLYDQLANNTSSPVSGGRSAGRNLSAADYIKAMEKIRPPKTDSTGEQTADFVPEDGVRPVSDQTSPSIQSNAEPIESPINSVDGTAGSSLKSSSKQTGTTGFDWPVEGRISSGYGERVHPILGQVRNHHGLDIAAGEGESFKAAAAGRVTFAGWTEGYGNLIEIDHGNGLISRYGHNQENLVAVGERITAGQTIGLVGNTGLSTGPHLHFEIRDQGMAVDPMARLSNPVAAATATATKVSSKTGRSG